MLNHLTLIFACQLVGETITRAFETPLPGPVIGMVLLFCYCSARGHVPEDLGQIGDTLLKNLSLLFVPAGVGVMAHGALFARDAVPIISALIGSTLITIGVTGWLMQRLNRKTGAPSNE
ncbi:MAG: CidA/LrgA family protein [Phyllobacteriaceae bacterium]|nr:CidA/LrgA family protein [Phyllobacteriaceae bacterium]